MTLELCGIISIIAVIFAVYSIITVSTLKGYIDSLKNAPVLRQYVKEFVPIDNSEEARAIIEEKMLKSEQEFTKAFNFNGDFKAEDLV